MVSLWNSSGCSDETEAWSFSLGLLPPVFTLGLFEIIASTGHWNVFDQAFCIRSHDCLTTFQANGHCNSDKCLFHKTVVSSTLKVTMVYKEEPQWVNSFLVRPDGCKQHDYMHCSERWLSSSPGLLGLCHRSATPAAPDFTSGSHKMTSQASNDYPGLFFFNNLSNHTGFLLRSEVSSKHSKNHKNTPQIKQKWSSHYMTFSRYFFTSMWARASVRSW